ncbi:hypothetical protein D081_0485 [Anaerovibrio sp. JC8]|uniref:hypothetical protein n=1 Tax=Anaerovibrio sp. JC8 TaxID=1240085 RepID=UPI000A0C0602|nr:hypothetical protein [Anaerovibrio sp. JC8]ORU01037.1 hypothetical protein D081_0485 [Anaerovibrio sp. JC8]
MQGMLKFLAEKAGRHVLQLLEILKECMLARIALFIAVCALLFLILTATDGLGDSSQAITAFSEGSADKEDRPSKTGFKEIKGMKGVQEFHGLHNPFGENEGTKIIPKSNKGAKEGGENGGIRATTGGGSNASGNKKAAPKAPHIRGVMEGKEGTAVLLEYGGSQYMLYPGEGTGDLSVESIEGHRVKVKVNGRELWVEK